MTAALVEPIRVLVVDDEPLARVGISHVIRADSEINLVGECASGELAISAIRERRPDIVLLDVEMPGVSGFDVIDAVGQNAMPIVVFLTAHEEFALDAFDVQAIDYVLKPFEDQRLLEALARAKNEVRTRALARVGRAVQGGFVRQTDARSLERPEGIDRIVIREAGRVVFVDAVDVDWIAGADYYSQLHVGARALLVRQTLHSLAETLDRARFMRIHRSAIVNLARVREIRAVGATGDAVVVLRDGTRVKLSRAKRTELEERLSASR